MPADGDTLIAVCQCVDRVVGEFLDSPHRFHAEHSLHSALFHYLSLAGACKDVRTEAGYPVATLQHEYPPISRDEGKGRLGLYDLVIFSRETLMRADHWNMRLDDQTKDGRPLSPLVAVEMGLDKGLAKDPRPENVGPRLAEFRKDLERLKKPGNCVQHGFLAYLYKYDIRSYSIAHRDETRGHREGMRRIATYLRKEAEESTRQVTNDLVVIIAATGYDPNFRLVEKSELRIVRGIAKKAVGPLFASV